MKQFQLILVTFCFLILSFQIIGCSSREPEVQDESALATGVNDALEGTDAPVAADQGDVAPPAPPVDEPVAKEQSSAPAAPPPTTLPPKTKVSTPPPSVVEAPAPTPSPKEKKGLPAKVAAKKEVVSAGKGSFKTTNVPCPMKAKPNPKAKVLTTVPEGRKLWVEKAGSYYKVFRKKDAGYLAASCFAK